MNVQWLWLNSKTKSELVMGELGFKLFLFIYFFHLQKDVLKTAALFYVLLAVSRVSALS